MYLQRLLMHNDTVARMEPFDFAQDRLREIQEPCLSYSNSLLDCATLHPGYLLLSPFRPVGTVDGRQVVYGLYPRAQPSSCRDTMGMAVLLNRP